MKTARTWAAAGWIVSLGGLLGCGALASAQGAESKPGAASSPSPSPLPAAGTAPPADSTRAERSLADLTLDRFEWGKEVAGEHPIRAVLADNDYGDVRARYAGDGRLAVHAVIQRLGQSGAGVTVERRGDTIAVKVGYGAGRLQDSDPEPRKDSLDRVDLVVYVPEGVRFEAHTFRGMVEVRKLRSDVRAATRDGSIFVLTTGSVQARSESGDITAFPGGGGARPLLFETRSGAVSVTLPEKDAAFDVRAETGAKIESDLDLKRRAVGARTLATGTAGAGGRLLFATSETGKVALYRWPGP